MHKIGIRYEDKYLMEKRVPLVPQHVKQLVEMGIEIQVVPSEKRIFKDSEYKAAGAKLMDEPLDADVILGLKEMPLNYFQPFKTYFFFSHTIKGQAYNMPLLRNMMESEINLIDYERIVDEKERRLIFFGYFAGLAGTINSLWSLGQRMKIKGVKTPFLKIKQTHQYGSIEEAKTILSEVGQEIKEHGLPKELTPLVVGITGYGNVSKGAQKILSLLPVQEITPAELLKLRQQTDLPNNVVYKVVFEERHLSAPKEQGRVFDLQEYYQHPELFKGVFEQYLLYLNVLMNCMYWDDRYPRIVTKDFLEIAWEEGTIPIEVIGDVTCDPDGSVEITHIGTAIDDPVFVYNPLKRNVTMGFEGEGVLVMAVNILPSELPRESSQAFSDALIKFLPELLKTDFEVSFDELKMPAPLKKALILHHGNLTPDYQYLINHI